MKVKMIATGKVEEFNESYARRLYCAGLAVLAEDADGGNDADGADGTDGVENASGDSLPGSNPALIFPEGNTPAASNATGADAEPLAGGDEHAAGADAEPLADGTDGAENASGDPLPGSNPALISPEGDAPAASDAAKTDKPGKGRKSR